MKRIISIAAGLAGGMLAMACPPAHAEIKVGDSVSGVKLPGSDGKEYNLDDFKDKQAVVMVWYPMAFTGG
jgi:peroxiredoxin Q/BCP